MECEKNNQPDLDITVSLTHTNIDNHIKIWCQRAFKIALQKLIETNGNLDIVMQTGEAFGRALFSQHIATKPTTWTINDWITHISTNILNKTGHTTNLEAQNNYHATLTIHDSPLIKNTNETHVAGLFEYAMIRGLLRSAYPKGEVILNTTMVTGAPLTELLLKTTAVSKDHLAYEQAKKTFTTTRKL